MRGVVVNVLVLSEIVDMAAAEFGGAGRAVEGVGIAVAEAGFPEAVQVAVRVDFAAVSGFKGSLRCFDRFQNRNILKEIISTILTRVLNRYIV